MEGNAIIKSDIMEQLNLFGEPVNKAVKTQKFEKLYKKNSTGGIQEWNIWLEQVPDGYLIKTSHGLLGGKIAEDKGKLVKAGKNVGRANKTTPETQALSEAQSKFQSKIDEGYRTSVEEARAYSVVKPMLALEYQKEKKVFPPYLCQPKLDGVRCLTFVKDKTFISRENNAFLGFEHINEDLKDIPDKYVLDGEFYSHGMPFQKIMSIVSKKKKINASDKQKLKLHLFDLIDLENPNMPFLGRYEKLQELIVDKKYLTIVDCGPILNSEDDIIANRDYYISQGYEGIMLRKDAPYVGKRTKSLLKYKDTEDAEFIIVGHKEGQGNDAGTVVWRCKTDKGVEFDVRPLGEYEDRARALKNAESYYGKKYTVRFQGFFEDGSPRFPRGIGVRDYE
jgi:ATP-dependent DNA ligase